MTQNTQTTVERLLALIANNQQTIRTGSIKLIDHGRAANLIAAEIDRLTAEAEAARQGRYQEHDRVVELRGQLNAARAEVERLTPAADLGVAYMAYMDEEVDYNDVAALQDTLETAMFRACKAAEASAAKEHKP